jgi:uncharacterized protein
VVKAGDVVKVRVKDVDVARKRIALTMKSGAVEREGEAASRAPGRQSGPRSAAPPPRSASQPPAEGALAAALRRAQERR